MTPSGRRKAGGGVNEATAELAAFMRRISPELDQPQHLMRLLDHISPALLGQPMRRLICMPPRHGKTTALLHLMAYLLVCCGTVRVAYATYANKRAGVVSKQLRRLVGTRCGAVIGDEFGGEKSAFNWMVRRTGGAVMADGMLGQWGGEGFNLIVVDDPFAGRDEAESGVIRDRTWDAYANDILSRQLPNGTAIVVMHTRWHLDDVAGRIIEGRGGEPYQALVMPAVSDEGEALWPGVWPAGRLEPFRAEAYNWASLYQQQPRPRGMAVFEGEPGEFSSSEWTRANCHGAAIVLDPAGTAKTSSDFSAAALCAMRGYGADAVMDVPDLMHGQWPMPEVIRRLDAMWRRWGAAVPVFVEAVGGFSALPDIIREMAPALSRWVRPIKSTPLVKINSDKFTRAQPVGAAWNTRRVRLPTGVPWRSTVIGQAHAFTGQDDPHDDIVDVLAHGWNVLYRARPETQRVIRTVNNLPYG